MFGAYSVPRDHGALMAWLPAIGFCQGSPMRAEIEALDPSGLAAATEAVAAAVGLAFGAGPIEAPMQALVVTARKFGAS